MELVLFILSLVLLVGVLFGLAFVFLRSSAKKQSGFIFIKSNAIDFLREVKERNGLAPLTVYAYLKEGEKCFHLESSAYLGKKIVSEVDSTQEGKGTLSLMPFISKRLRRKSDKGELLITNQRLSFLGESRRYLIPIREILGIKCFWGSIALKIEGLDECVLFKSKNPLILASILYICSNIKNPEDFGKGCELNLEIA